MDKYRYIKVLILSAGSSFVISHIENFALVFMIQLLCVVSIVLVCYYECIRKVVFYTLWVMAVVEMINMLSTLIVNTVGTVMNLQNIVLEDFIAVLLSLSVIYAVGRCLFKTTDIGIQNIRIRYIIMFTVILFVDLMILSLMVKVTLEEMAYKNKVLYIISYTFVVLGVFIQLAAVILLMISRNRYWEQAHVAQKYLEEQTKYYEYLKNKEKETKKFRHDIKSHLYLLNKLKRERKDAEFEIYFQDIIGKVDELENSVDVGNDIVNAVLSKAYAEAQERNISMEIKGAFPPVCHIRAYHLCTIFFNLLTNAIEAADKTNSRKIWVICQTTPKEIIVEIGNSFCKENDLDKNNFKTRKNEKEYHGWGLKNVEDSVKACKGIMDIDVNENQFIVSLVLNNKEENEDILVCGLQS